MEEVPVLVYVVCDARKLELPSYLGRFTDTENSRRRGGKQRLELRYFQEDWIRRRGGRDTLEYDLGETCRWFARIGQIQLPPRTGWKIRVPRKMVQPLMDCWVASGSPKEIGWRQKEVELYRAAEKALERAAAARADGRQRVYGLKSISPALNEVPNILERLDAHEIVHVDVTAFMQFVFKTSDGMLYSGEETLECQLCIRREKAEHDFGVRVEVQGEMPLRPN
jgi:hypothetical protein